MSMIQKMSMGVSKPAATTNQYCVSESLSMMSHVKDTLTRLTEEIERTRLYSTRSVLSASSLASQTHLIVSFFYGDWP